MDISTILSFLGASILLTVTPGPDILFVITESLTKGQRTGIAISVGLVSGLIVHITMAYTGLSLAFQTFPELLNTVKFAGAAYLLYLAYKAYGEEKPETTQGQTLAVAGTGYQVSAIKLVRKGILMNVLNPKVSLFFLLFLPQFVQESATMSSDAQILSLGGLFILQALLIFSSVSVLSGRLTGLLNSDRFWSGTKIVKIIALCGIAAMLAL
ncbi:LysE family translocator (plasmid) [Fulvitalea axinellae]|uniref:LysE family translocator n=1 Tax=Fulvitalea axinellae TaxID=1182444 RepID=A0AAU9CXB5_9BACT|nr:LysE family translocator [Fulvitalea axinellae]